LWAVCKNKKNYSEILLFFAIIPPNRTGRFWSLPFLNQGLFGALFFKLSRQLEFQGNFLVKKYLYLYLSIEKV